jgi:hypothetical protein
MKKQLLNESEREKEEEEEEEDRVCCNLIH